MITENKDRTARHSLDQLLAMLSSSNHFDRAEAARQICNMGKDAVRALPAVLALVNDPWYQVRIQIPRAIIHMEARSDDAVEVLNRLLEDEDETVRLYAKEAQRVLIERRA